MLRLVTLVDSVCKMLISTEVMIMLTLRTSWEWSDGHSVGRVRESEDDL